MGPISISSLSRFSTRKWDAPCWTRFGAAGKFKWPCGGTKTISTGLVDLGSFQFFRSDGGATNPPIKEVGPTIVFDRAFDSEQSVGARFRPAASRVYQSGNGMQLAGSDSVRPGKSNGLEEEQNDINKSCRTGCVPVLSIRRRRKDASNRGFRHTIDFDAAFGGEQALAADFDQRHLAFSLSKVNGMHLAELERARFGKCNQVQV